MRGVPPVGQSRMGFQEFIHKTAVLRWNNRRGDSCGRPTS
jgi:hypothetical protein